MKDILGRIQQRCSSQYVVDNAIHYPRHAWLLLSKQNRALHITAVDYLVQRTWLVVSSLILFSVEQSFNVLSISQLCTQPPFFLCFSSKEIIFDDNQCWGWKSIKGHEHSDEQDDMNIEKCLGGGGCVAFHGLCPSNSWPLTIIWIYYWTLAAPQHHYSTYNDSFYFRGEQLCHSGFPQQYLGESNKTNNVTPSGCHADPNIRMYSSASAWRPWLWPILSVGMVPPKHERTEKWRGDARTDASPPKRRQLFGNNSAGHPAHLQLCGLSVQSSFSFFMAFPWRAITTPWILLSHINTHFILQAYVK